MASSWRDRSLSDVVSLQRGHDLTEGERKPGKVPVFGSAGHNGFHNIALASGPGIVIGRSGASFGKVHFSPCDYWPHNTALYVTDFKGNNARFVYYLLRGIDFTAFNSGSAQPSLNRNYIANIKVSLPDPVEQARVAATVAAFDERIALLRDTNSTLEDMARLLFRAWFVDFEPVRAKMNGSAPTSCDAATAALFPDRFVESELGVVPEGWTWQRLDATFDINPSRKLSKGDVAPYLDMSNAPTEGHRAGAWIDRPLNSGSKFINGDTLLAKITPCLENGKTAYVDFLNDGQVGWGSTEFIVLRPKPPIPEYVAYLLCRTDAFRDVAIRSMTGTSGRQRVPVDGIAGYPIPSANMPVWDVFHRQIAPIAQSIRHNSEKAESLAKVRDELLPRLMSGSLVVSEAA